MCVPVPSSFEASESDCSELLSLSVHECDKAVLWLVLVALKSIGLMQWTYKTNKKQPLTE